jgi:hypothetical protein
MSALKKVAVGVGLFVCACVAFDLGGRMLFPEKWKELDAKVEADRSARKEAAKKAAAQKENDKKPSGATIAGGIAAIDLANAGGLKPSAEQVNALARRSATQMDVPQEERSKFVREFTHGFWVGWKTANQ